MSQGSKRITHIYRSGAMTKCGRVINDATGPAAPAGEILIRTDNLCAECVALTPEVAARPHVDDLRAEAAASSKRPTTDQPDWTAENGCANSSAKFRILCLAVEQQIRGSAADIVNGHLDQVARRIVATLAHEWGMRPVDPSRFNV